MAVAAQLADIAARAGDIGGKVEAYKALFDSLASAYTASGGESELQALGQLAGHGMCWARGRAGRRPMQGQFGVVANAAARGAPSLRSGGRWHPAGHFSPSA